ncbi:LCP family protein [Microbacterium stercoris]|uniref:LCP family protein n=1 Tax=Microbacterium stercoris TaxID=2820289 RepID=A0A939QGN2_9MICO|nr:LCP family protein [Microbacterium stercoris]MBO3662599.1 LCP family protein [Microbacterium stercoris]
MARRGVNRRVTARHARLPRERRGMRRLVRGMGIGLAVLLVAGIGTVVYGYWDLSRTFTENAQQLDGQDVNPPDIGALVGTEGVDLLLVGLDICEWASHERHVGRCPQERSAYDEDGRDLQTAHNDVNLLVRISPEPRRVTVTAFPRDLMVPIPSCTNQKGESRAATSHTMLNEAYGRGELNCVAQTLNALVTPFGADLAIDYAASVTWNGVVEITNALGGVDICVAEEIFDPDAGGLHLEPGPHTLVGEQALQFLRMRKTLPTGSDLARISNQQIYMSALVRKLTDQGTLSDPGLLLSLARTALSNIDPSTELTDPFTLVQLAMAAKDVPTSDYVFLQVPATDDPLDPDRVVPIDAEVEKLFTAIAANVPISPTGTYFDPDANAGANPDPPVAPSGTPAPGASAAPPPPAPEVLGRNATDTTCAG